MTENIIIINTVLNRDFIVYKYFKGVQGMNIFEISPNVLSVDDEKDLEFLKTSGKGFIQLKYGKLNVGDVICTNSVGKNYYIVKPLDTIKSVADKLGRSEEDIKRRAGSKNLFIGQRIDLD